MKAQNRQPPTRPQKINRLWQNLLKRPQFVVHGDTQSLETPGSRMNPPPAPTYRCSDDLSQLAGRPKWTGHHNRPGDAPTLLFFAKAV
jgi:hypothetical protein